MLGSIEEIEDFFMAIWEEVDFEGYTIEGITQLRGTNKVAITLFKGGRNIQVTIKDHDDFYTIYVESKEKLMAKNYTFESEENLFEVINFRVKEIDKEFDEEEKQEEFRDLLIGQWRAFNG